MDVTTSPILDNETGRLHALRRYRILDTPPTERFDRITRLAARLFDVPIALVSLVDEGRQWFKSRCGIEVEETSRDVSFCAHAILSRGVMVVPDAREDLRFADNPLVTGPPYVRFYAGAPLIDPAGFALGTLCLIDTRARRFPDDDAAALQDLAAIVIEQLEMHEAGGETVSEAPGDESGVIDLLDTRDMLRLFIEHVPAAVAMFDRDMRYLAVSNQWLEEYGLARQELLGRSHYQVFPDLPLRWRDIYERCLAGEIERSEEDFFERADGRTEWLKWAIHPWRHSSGRIGGIVMFTELITKRKAENEKMERQEQFLNSVLENISDGIVACDETGRLILFNRSTRELHGVHEEAIPPEKWAEHYNLYRADGETLMEKSEVPLYRAFQGETVKNQEMVIAPKDAPRRVLLANGSPMFDKQGRKLGAVASMHDISERVEIEHQLQHAQKMEAVGQLTGGLAHDFNNLLTIVIGNLQLLEQDLSTDPIRSRRLNAAIEAANRGAKLTRQLLALSRRQVLEPEIIDIDAHVAELEQLLKRTLGDAIEVRTRVAPDTHSIHVDSSLLESALLNLAINARDAMDGEGRLAIEVQNSILDEQHLSQNPAAAPGNYVRISVIDTGPGMPRDVLDRAFEPFFTTKEPGKGTGLGLSMVYSFARQSKGHVEIHSRPGEGTRIELYLPCATVAEITEDLRITGRYQSIPNGSERVLVVEDDAAVRGIAVTLLGSLGYKTTEACSGREALEILDRDTDIELLFTDIVMPGGMNGAELARKAQDHRPGLKILFTSGHTENTIVRDGRLRPGTHLLGKPYRKQELALKVRQALDEPVPEAAAG
ncbi:hypothetical protein BH24PSE2_BH24PSE2_21050 [soil metagenome]